MRWMSAKRKDNQLETIVLLFVYRAENFSSMEKLAVLGKELGMDGIFYSPFLPWERMAIGDYESQAIHLPSHPLHQVFLEKKNALQSKFGSWINFT